MKGVVKEDKFSATAANILEKTTKTALLLDDFNVMNDRCKSEV